MIINTRLVERDDSKDIWLWRNDEDTRHQSTNQDLISLENHESWFLKVLENNRNLIYISLSDKKEKIGMTRFDFNKDKNKATVSINLNPLYRGMGIGPMILQSAIDIFRLDYKINLEATIRKNNMPSIKCFKKCGFVLDTDSGKFSYFTNNI